MFIHIMTVYANIPLQFPSFKLDFILNGRILTAETTVRVEVFGTFRYVGWIMDIHSMSIDKHTQYG